MTAIRWRRHADGQRWAYLIWKDQQRRQHSRPLGTTDPLLAKAMLRDHRLGKGEAGTGTATGLGATEAARAFLKAVEPSVAAETMRCYRGQIDRLVRAWADVEPVRWTAAMFRLYVADHPGWAPRTVQMLRDLARRFVRWARKEGWPVPDFVGDFRGPRMVQKRPDAIDRKALTKVLRVARGRYGEAAAALAGLAGLRLGEVQRAEWVDLDGKARTLRVRGRKGHLERTVPVSPELWRILKPLRGDGLIVPGADATSLRPTLRACGAAAGLTRYPTLRILRHTFATRLVAEGVDLATVQYLMGHKSAVMTLRYAHHDAERARAAVAKV